MKRMIFATIAMVLMLCPLAMGAKVLRSYDWNGKRYTVIQNDDGSTVEIKHKTSEKPDEALAKAVQWKAAADESKGKAVAEPNPLAGFSDDQILVEIQRRGLLIEGAGNMGLKKGLSK